MSEIPGSIASKLCSLCSSAKTDSILKISPGEFGDILTEKKDSKFTGVLRLSFKEKGNLVSLYCVLLRGSPVLCMREEVSAGKFFMAKPEEFDREGALEVLILPEDRLEAIAHSLPAEIEAEVQEVPQAEVREEILKFKEKLEKEAERQAEEAIKAMKPDVEKLKKTKLSPEKCMVVIDYIERELSEIFGEAKAKNLLKLRLTEMKFSKENATCEVVAELIDYLRRFTLKRKLGKEEADRVADRMLWKLAEVAESYTSV